MSQVVIDNPILNSAFAEPNRHFRFDDDGITNEITLARGYEGNKESVSTASLLIKAFRRSS